MSDLILVGTLGQHSIAIERAAEGFVVRMLPSPRKGGTGALVTHVASAVELQALGMELLKQGIKEEAR